MTYKDNTQIYEKAQSCSGIMHSVTVDNGELESPQCHSGLHTSSMRNLTSGQSRAVLWKVCFRLLQRASFAFLSCSQWTSASSDKPVSQVLDDSISSTTSLCSACKAGEMLTLFFA